MKLIACAFLLTAGAWGQPESRPVGVSLDADLAVRLPQIRKLMVDGLKRDKPRDPTCDDLAPSESTVFHGSFDRHSNIAAYWSLLSWARRNHETHEVDSLLQSFPADRLRSESEFVDALVSSGGFRAYPYDDAWLLFLLREIDRINKDHDVGVVARGFASRIEKRLLDYLEKSRLPSAAETRNHAESRPATSSKPSHGIYSRWLSGAYDSAVWPMIVMQLAPSTLIRARQRLARAANDRIPFARRVPAAIIDTRVMGMNFDFFASEALLAIADALRTGPAETCTGYSLPALEPPGDRITLANCHALGRELVKLWPVAWNAGNGNVPARRLFNERLRLILTDERAWAGPFLTVSHWMPQFLYLTIWLADGRP